MNRANLIYMAGLLLLVLLFLPLRRLAANDWVFVGGAIFYLLVLRIVVAVLARREKARQEAGRADRGG